MKTWYLPPLYPNDTAPVDFFYNNDRLDQKLLLASNFGIWMIMFRYGGAETEH
ncbi:MAG: hypothetical protein WD097_08440 [Balneolales bacterium]